MENWWLFWWRAKREKMLATSALWNVSLRSQHCLFSRLHSCITSSWKINFASSWSSEKFAAKKILGRKFIFMPIKQLWSLKAKVSQRCWFGVPSILGGALVIDGSTQLIRVPPIIAMLLGAKLLKIWNCKLSAKNNIPKSRRHVSSTTSAGSRNNFHVLQFDFHSFFCLF